VSTLTARMDFPPAERSVPAARRAVRLLLDSWGVPAGTEDVELVVSELLGNAVQHAGTEASLELELAFSPPSLRVSVADGSAVRPLVRELESHAHDGRGLHIVEALGERWGAEDHHGGKRIWVEMSVGA
jgi:anti-sigma regulatory factor (Ser/Thr protein kinase)